MNRIIFSIILFTIYACNGYSQTISEVIADMPQSIIWGLATDQKEDLVSNPTDTTALIIKDNDLYTSIERKSLSESYLNLNTTESGNVQIKLLPLINDSKVICVIKTVCKGFCDSNISFYTPKWIPIDKVGLYPKPELDWFLKTEIDKQSEDFKNAIAMVDILPIKLSLSPNAESLIVELDIQNYMDEKSYNDLKPFLNDTPKILTWDKTSFK